VNCTVLKPLVSNFHNGDDQVDILLDADHLFSSKQDDDAVIM
jgi:hypothetical protein